MTDETANHIGTLFPQVAMAKAARQWYEKATAHVASAAELERRAASTAKARGDKFQDLLEKLKSNGLYGKLGQGLGNRKTAKVAEDNVRSNAVNFRGQADDQWAEAAHAFYQTAICLGFWPED